MLRVKKLVPHARLPECAHPGEDLGYDLFALEDTTLNYGNIHPTKIRTGIALASVEGYGFLMKDRSSMAQMGIYVHGGVIDGGYRGEIMVIVTSANQILIRAGEKIAQLIPIKALTIDILEVADFIDLPASRRGEAGFGSTGA